MRLPLLTTYHAAYLPLTTPPARQQQPAAKIIRSIHEMYSMAACCGCGSSDAVRAAVLGARVQFKCVYIYTFKRGKGPLLFVVYLCSPARSLTNKKAFSGARHTHSHARHAAR
jgi:hypothetical protein